MKGIRTDRNTGAPAGRLGLLCLVLFVAAATLLPRAAAAEEVRSRAAVVMDAETGRLLYAKNPDLRLQPASTTKLMTALVVVERANLKEITTVSKYAASAPATRMGLREGERVTIETLLSAALMKSANDAAVALAEAVAGSEEKFVELMNRKALAIGATDTHFINANGLPGDGQYITAHDLSRIMRHAIKHPVLKEILGTRVTEVATETGRQIFLRNTNRLLWSDEELIGGKTGYTKKARHCFVCAGEREKETIIVALLGTPSRELLWKESEDLMGFGAKVMNKSEEPVVYLAKADYAPSVVKAAYTKKARSGRVRMKAASRRGASVQTAQRKSGKTKMAARHRKSSRMVAKNRKSRRPSESGVGDGA